MSDLARAATLASLDGVAPVQRKPRHKSELPAAVDQALGGLSLDQIKWRKKAPGVALFDIPMPKGSSSALKLLSIGPGRAMPEHGHGGEELTLRTLEEKTPLLRCHRQYLVNLAHVREIRLSENGLADIVTRGEQTVPVSRRSLKPLKERLGIPG